MPGPCAKFLSLLLQILRVSASLTDAQKMTAEWYDDKLVSLGSLPIWIAALKGMDAHTSAGLFLVLNCIYDATIVTWKEKVRHNAVRPMSLVHHLYGDTLVRAYAGRWEYGSTLLGAA
jgi:hypothetical protein